MTPGELADGKDRGDDGRQVLDEGRLPPQSGGQQLVQVGTDLLGGDGGFVAAHDVPLAVDRNLVKFHLISSVPTASGRVLATCSYKKPHSAPQSPGRAARTEAHTGY